MAYRPTLRVQQWRLVLTALILVAFASTSSADHALSERVLAPAAAANSSCPPDPCVPGNQVGRDFFVGVVALLADVPMSDFAVDILIAWEDWENTEACWNPLATTQKMSVICNFNETAFVQSYQDQVMGVQATAITLNLGYYNAIRSMLRTEAFDREALRAALDTWGTYAGSTCDPYLNVWKAMWDAQVGCCGCLPAACCSGGLAVVAGRTDPAQSAVFQVAAPVPTAPAPPQAVAPSELALQAMPVTQTMAVEPAPPSETAAPASVVREPVEPLRVAPGSANYLIPKAVFGSGGAKVSASYRMNGTQGQATDLSLRQSTNYRLIPGYWGPVSTVPVGSLGGVNDDGLVNSTDALIILTADVGLDTSQFCPMNCGDVNGDGLVNSTDALIVLTYDVGLSVPFPVGTGACQTEVTQPPGCNP